jgi:hypothetical protein
MISVKDYIKAIDNSGGIITNAADALKCSRQAYAQIAAIEANERTRNNHQVTWH